MKTVFLHFGLHKTGTSSIQETLRISHDILLDYGINYPIINDDEVWYEFQNDLIYNHSFNFIPIFIKDFTGYHYFRDKKIYTKEEAEAEKSRLLFRWEEIFKSNKCNKFIISAENLVSLDSDELREIRAYLLKYFNKIQCIVYVREFVPWASSCIQQTIRHGQDNYNISFQRDVKGEIDRIINAFGHENIIVHKFDSATFLNNDLIDDFLSIICDGPDIPIIDRTTTNESLDIYSVTFLREYNKEYPFYCDGQLNTDRGLSKYGFTAVPFIFSKINEYEKFRLDIVQDKYIAEDINKQIDYLNGLLDPRMHLKHVEVSSKSLLLQASEIPVKYYIELINIYNKEIERYLDDIYESKTIARNLKKKNEDKDNLLSEKNNILLLCYSGRGKSIKNLIYNLFQYVYYKIKGSAWFEWQYYLKKYPHVLKKTKHLFLHFMFRGVYYGYDPNPTFHAQQYIIDNPEIIITGVNAYLHSIKNSKRDLKKSGNHK